MSSYSDLCETSFDAVDAMKLEIAVYLKTEGRLDRNNIGFADLVIVAVHPRVFSGQLVGQTLDIVI